MSAPPPRTRNPIGAGLQLQRYDIILKRQNKTAIIFDSIPNKVGSEENKT